MSSFYFNLNGEVPVSVIEDGDIFEELLGDYEFIEKYEYEDDDWEDDDYEDEEDDWEPPVKKSAEEQIKEGLEAYEKIINDPEVEIHEGVYDRIKDSYKYRDLHLEKVSEEEKKKIILGIFLGPLYDDLVYEGKNSIVYYYDIDDLFPAIRSKNLSLFTRGWALNLKWKGGELWDIKGYTCDDFLELIEKY